MSGLITKGNWRKIKAKLIEDYPALTKRDLIYEEGKEERLIGELQLKLGKTKAEISDMIRSLLDD
ncbi:general stress protein CsbD [Aliifodinibius salicampi]|uniref:General stress protein CsbD n=1 Tax=Fodinibius salicampi TaxID=1920655 RepID=A0ABT3PX50_9BACT|nr:general stress protein CsbD [Fodinibius salicampi]MCW9712413.1 general stress protein CsbD [Fodinibius salicampi]